eukprot:SAG11_NODE_1529_length_4738_cov_1.628799_6_plen_162_part_00
MVRKFDISRFRRYTLYTVCCWNRNFWAMVRKFDISRFRRYSLGTARKSTLPGTKSCMADRTTLWRIDIRYLRLFAPCRRHRGSTLCRPQNSSLPLFTRGSDMYARSSGTVLTRQLSFYPGSILLNLVVNLIVKLCSVGPAVAKFPAPPSPRRFKGSRRYPI